MALTIRTIRLIDLYKIPIQTDDEYVANLFINQEVEKRQEEVILEAKKKL